MRILLVDDHAIVRQGFRRLLAGEFTADFGDATHAHEALTRAIGERWDLVILDISLPGRSGLDVLKELHAAKPTLPVLVMTMHAADQYAIRAFRAGAAGYITKDCAPEELTNAVRKLLGGGKYVPPALAEKLATSIGSSEKPPHEELSDREFQVLRMFALGKTVSQIGRELHLSEKTISTYRTRMLEKMKLSTTAELVHYAIRNNLVD
jgi:two-component system, NarL family, invasion response regulator UvrY